MSRIQIHDTPAPASIGVIAAFLRHVLSTVRLVKGNIYRGHIMPDYITWSNGIGVSRLEDQTEYIGTTVKVVTGKARNTPPSFDKHLKMFQCMALQSFLYFPINSSFGDGAIDIPRIR